MTRLRHRFELRLAVMAMAALMFAQLGAMTHAYSHDVDRGASSAHFSGSVTHGSCGECLAYAPLLSAAGASGAPLFLAPEARDAVTRVLPDSRVARLPCLAFRSRAPPSTP